MAEVAPHLLIRCLTMTLLTLPSGHQTAKPSGARKATPGGIRFAAAMLALAPPAANLAAGKPARNQGPRHSRARQTSRSGTTSSMSEVTRRARGQSRPDDTRVIVTLRAGRRAAGRSSSGSSARAASSTSSTARCSSCRTASSSSSKQRPEIFQRALRPADLGFELPHVRHRRRDDRPRRRCGYTGAGIGVAVIDSGITHWHDDLSPATADSSSYPYGNQRVAQVRRLRQRPDDCRTTTTATARTSPASSPATATTRAWARRPASRPKRVDRRAEGARRQRRRARSATIIAALNWVAANHATYNIRVVNLSVGARDQRVVLDRPADARGQGADRPGHRGRRRGRQPRQERGRAAAVRRHHGAGQRAVGADGRRVEHEGHADARPTTRWRASARAGPTYIDFARETRPGRAGTGTVSLAAPGSTFYATKSQCLVDGKREPRRPSRISR